MTETTVTMEHDRRTLLRALGAGSIGSIGVFATDATAADTDASGADPAAGSYYDLDDGFATVAPWLEEEDVRVVRVTEPTRSALEEAVTASGPRVVVFETSGTIDLGVEDLAITEDKCWIAGQTAPSPGITLIRGGFYVEANDCVVQHIRARAGDADQTSDWAPDSLHTGDDTRNNVIDHCSTSWGVDESLSVGYRTRNTTVTNCMAAESLRNASSLDETRGTGSLIGNDAANVAMMGNLWTDNSSRNPRLKTGTTSVLANNVVNYFDEAVNVDSDARTSVVGSAFVRGIDEGEGDPIIEGGRVYYDDNYTRDPVVPMATVDERLSSPPIWPEGLEPLSSDRVLEYVLSYVGARPADRSETDERLIEQLREGRGKWIDRQTEVGGYPHLEVNSRSLNVPKGGLRQWLRSHAVRVEQPGH